VEVKLIVEQEPVGELGDGDELVVAPALSDVEGRGVLPHDRLFGIQEVYQLYLVVVLVVVLVALEELQEHRQVRPLRDPVSSRIDLQPPLDPVDPLRLRVDDRLSVLRVLPQPVGEFVELGDQLVSECREGYMVSRAF
jgi:hypothetical protein